MHLGGPDRPAVLGSGDTSPRLGLLDQRGADVAATGSGQVGLGYGCGGVPQAVVDGSAHLGHQHLELGLSPEEFRRIVEPIHEGVDDGSRALVLRQIGNAIADRLAGAGRPGEVVVGVLPGTEAPALLESFGDVDRLVDAARNLLGSEEVHEVVPKGTAVSGHCRPQSFENLKLWLALSQPLLLDRLFDHLLS